MFGSVYSTSEPQKKTEKALFGFLGKKLKNQDPRRPDFLDQNSPAAKIKLQRAWYILSTLVPDPHSYHLILSNEYGFGGEALPPFVFSQKPTIIVYQGALSPDRSNEEIAFMMAHELGHLHLYHNERSAEKMDRIMHGSPLGISGIILDIFHRKIQEREADLFGFQMYKHAGYDLNFFPYTLGLIKINPNIHYGTTHIFSKSHCSLSMKDSHFDMKERFQLLSQKAKA